MNQQIFPFPDGSRFADPIRVERRLAVACDGDVNNVLRLGQSDNPDQAQQYIDVWLVAIAFAFEVQAFDQATGSGLGEEALMDLYDSFLDWKEKKNLTSGSMLNSQSAIQAMSPPLPIQAAASPTMLSTASG